MYSFFLGTLLVLFMIAVVAFVPLIFCFCYDLLVKGTMDDGLTDKFFEFCDNKFFNKIGGRTIGIYIIVFIAVAVGTCVTDPNTEKFKVVEESEEQVVLERTDGRTYIIDLKDYE